MTTGLSPTPQAADTATVKLKADDIRLLGEIAVSAVMRGHAAAAEPIFKALTELRPDRSLGPVGLALCVLARGDAETALRLLRDCARSGRRGSDQVHGMQLVVLTACGRAQGADAEAREMLAAADPGLRKAARTFLDQRAAMQCA